MKRVASRLRPIKNKSKGFNKYDTTTLNLNGRVMVDMLLLIMHHNAVPSNSQTKSGEFTLGEVAKRYLNQEKGDVDYMEIFQLQLGGPDTRKKLASYCVQDALLPYLLMMLQQYPSRSNSALELDILEFYIHQARETGVPLKYLLTKSTDYQTYFKRVRLVSPHLIVSIQITVSYYQFLFQCLTGKESGGRLQHAHQAANRASWIRACSSSETSQKVYF